MAAAFAGVGDAEGRAQVLRTELLARGDEDVRSYEPVLAAMRLGAQDPARQGRLDEALSGACEAPVAVARAAAEIAELAAAVAARSTHALEGEAVAAVLLADAASGTAIRLVEINLYGRASDPRLAEAAQLRDRVVAARERALGG